MHRKLSPPLQAFIFLLVAAVACSPFGPTPTPTVEPTPLPPIAPQVVDHYPAKGDEFPPDGTVVVYFDQAMDRASVQTAFESDPPLTGTFTWPDDRTVEFQPSSPLERASRYAITIDKTAKSAAGLTLPEAVTLNVDTVGFLEVTQVLPAPGTADADVASLITVMFNRPVVPLTVTGDQSTLPDPLTLDPPVGGTGEWLNTSIFVFRPDESLAGSTTYHATVASGLADTTGGVLKDSFEWDFSTPRPAVVETTPALDAADVRLDEPIAVTFNQPMDRASTQAAFTLSLDGVTLPGTFEWDEADKLLTFTPSRMLALGVQYEVAIDASAKSQAGGAALDTGFEWAFSTVQPVGILSTSPSDGATGADPQSGFRIRFASPMDQKTLKDNIAIDPKPGQTYAYWSDYDNTYTINWDLKPSTDYTVTIGADLADPYGNRLGAARVVRFTSRALEPTAYFNARGTVGTYNASQSAELFVTTLNVDELDLALYRLSMQDYARLTGPDAYSFLEKFKPAPADRLREWTLAVPNELNQRILNPVNLTEATDGRLDPGLYFLTLSSPQIGRTNVFSPYQILVVSGANLTLKNALRESLVWATDLDSGQPIANYPVTLYDQNFKKIASATTDADGVATFTHSRLPDLWTTLYAVSEGGPGLSSFSIGQSGWSDGIEPWDFGHLSSFYVQDLSVYFHTDRPVYRPGQVVYFRGVVRTEDDARYILPDLQTVPVVIYNDRGEEVYDAKLGVSEFGTIHGEFQIASDGGLGYYSLQAVQGDTQIGSIGFQVAEYHKPEFVVNVASPVAEVVQGATIPVEVSSEFFFGGAVSNADVHWSVLSAPYFFNYTGPGYYSFIDFDFSSGDSPEIYGSAGELISEGDGKTDSQGKFSLNVPTTLGDKTTSQTFTVEATVTDVNGQQVSGRTTVTVHFGEFYLGIRPTSYVGETGQPNQAEIIAVDWTGNPVPNLDVQVVVSQHEWFSVQEQDEFGDTVWTWNVKDTPVETLTAKTDSGGKATVSFTPDTGGTYKLLVTAGDSKGHTVRASTIVWVSSRSYVNWRQENNDRITLVADRKAYQPGDTAEILIPSPFQGSTTALVTIERGRILQHQVITLDTNSEILRVPITAQFAPNVFVSVLIVKGVDADNPAPSFKLGEVELEVSPEQQQINLTLTPDKTKVGPRDTVTYQLKATDHDGRPVKAEFSVGVSDLAALSLGAPNSGAILDHFYGERGLGVRTSTGLTLSVNRLNVLAQKAKGGGGGAGEGFFEIRGNFLDTAYWNAEVVTDENGEASVAVTLPDNLTTWRLDARGVSADTLVGQGTVDIVATKDLLVRPVTPRFFVVGDQAQLAAVVNNNTPNDLDVRVSLSGTGVTLAGEATQTVRVKANDRARVEWTAAVQDVPAVDLTFSASAGSLQDASKPPLGTPPEQLLPVYKYSAPITVGTAGQLEGGASVLESISLPRRFDVTQGDLTVELDPSLAASTVNGLEFLEHYPYECTEQTVSRFLPNLFTYRALKELGIEDPALENSLALRINVALQKLYSQQHVDGGWGWWTTDQSDANVSAYVVFGLAKARQSGFDVSEKVLSSAIQFLRGQLTNPATLEETWQVNRQAFIVYVLAESEQPEVSRTVALYESRARLDSYAQAYLALALSIVDPQDSRIPTLLSDLNNGAILSATGVHWEERAPDWWNMNTDLRSTAIVLDALARLDPGNHLNPNVVRWLMDHREANGAWKSTQETAWSLIALTDWMRATGELKANYNYDVTLNGLSLAAGSANPDNLTQPVTLSVAVGDLFKDMANRLVVNRGTGDGRLYYTAHLQVYRPVEEVRAESRGIVVGRQYTVASETCGGKDQPACPAVSAATEGQDIRVRLTIVAPNDLYHVLVEDPIPAGTEPIDTSLLTTSVVGQPPELSPADPLYYGWGWWWFSNTDLRDEKVVLFAEYLPKGTYEYTYTLHASLPGQYRVIPPVAQEFYFPEVNGRGDGMVFTINP